MATVGGPFPASLLVYERESYAQIFRQLVQHVHKLGGVDAPPVADVVVTGNPGVGKSCLYVYCAFRLALCAETLRGCQLVLECQGCCWAFRPATQTTSPGVFERLGPEQVRALAATRSVVRLVDSASSHAAAAREPVATPHAEWQGVSVLFATSACSSTHDRVRWFLKREVSVFVLPTWTLDELRRCNALQRVGLEERELVERVRKWGGVPRVALAKQPSQFDADVERAVQRVDAVRLCGISTVHVFPYDGCAQWLFKMVPQRRDCRRKFHWEFLTPALAARVLARVDAAGRLQLEAMARRGKLRLPAAHRRRKAA